jgi:hypothetical protein
MAASAATLRLQESAGRLLEHFGAERSFQRYAATKDWNAGSETWSASGAPIVARSDYVTIRSMRAGSDNGDAKVLVAEQVLHVEIPPFAAIGGLTDEYRFTDSSGVERRIESAVVDDDQSVYVVRWTRGGR